ncbi:MAG: hypothetical protein CML56_08585 [Rhodobacteraceae bacterium]|nr:hypothetical protein [Paracoccaceae bacterium]
MSFLNTAILKKLDLKVIRLLSFLTVVTGCAHGKKFSSHFGQTESLCINGLVASMEDEKCTSIYVGGNSRIEPIIIKCMQYKKETFWTSSRFYIFPSAEYESIDTSRMMPVCQDGLTTLFIEISK